MRTCARDGCEVSLDGKRPHALYCSDRCRSLASQVRRGRLDPARIGCGQPGPAPQPLSLRFWAGVELHDADECWPWIRHRDSRGYGRLNVGSIAVLAHRIAWELTHGSVPDGLCVLHRCDNPPCCNPAHLFLGTVADNNADRDAKARIARTKEGRYARSS